MLLNEGDSCRQQPSLAFVTIQPKVLRGNHELQDLGSIRQCIMCRKDIQKRVFVVETSGKKGDAPRTEPLPLSPDWANE